MSAAVADTQAVLWYLLDSPRLTAAADAALTAAEQSQGLYISVMTIVEVVYLLDKRGFAYPTALGVLRGVIGTRVFLLPVALAVAEAVALVPRAEVPDMPDRIIAATAVAHGLPLISADTYIRASAGLAVLTRVVW